MSLTLRNPNCRHFNSHFQTNLKIGSLKLLFLRASDGEGLATKDTSNFIQFSFFYFVQDVGCNIHESDFKFQINFCVFGFFFFFGVFVFVSEGVSQSVAAGCCWVRQIPLSSKDVRPRRYVSPVNYAQFKLFRNVLLFCLYLFYIYWFA